MRIRWDDDDDDEEAGHAARNASSLRRGNRLLMAYVRLLAFATAATTARCRRDQVAERLGGLMLDSDSCCRDYQAYARRTELYQHCGSFWGCAFERILKIYNVHHYQHKHQGLIPIKRTKDYLSLSAYIIIAILCIRGGKLQGRTIIIIHWVFIWMINMLSTVTLARLRKNIPDKRNMLSLPTDNG